MDITEQDLKDLGRSQRTGDRQNGVNMWSNASTWMWVELRF